MRTHSLEGRKWEERVGELRNVARHKRALTRWRGGRGRSGMVSFETWHVTKDNQPLAGRKRGDRGGSLPNLATHKTKSTTIQVRKAGAGSSRVKRRPSKTR